MAPYAHGTGSNCVAQDTIADMAKDMVKNRTGGSQASAAELYDFMKKVRCCMRAARLRGSYIKAIVLNLSESQTLA